MVKLPKLGQYKWDNFPDNEIINSRGILQNGFVLYLQKAIFAEQYAFCYNTDGCCS